MFLSSSPLIPVPFQLSLSISLLLLFPSLPSPLLLLFFPTSLKLLPYLFLPLHPPPPLTYTPLIFNLFLPSLVSIFLVLFSRHHFSIILSSCLPLPLFRLFSHLLSTPPISSISPLTSTHFLFPPSAPLYPLFFQFSISTF
jgi:hypothetical protein